MRPLPAYTTRPAAAARTGWPSRPPIPMPVAIPSSEPNRVTTAPSVGQAHAGAGSAAAGAGGAVAPDLAERCGTVAPDFAERDGALAFAAEPEDGGGAAAADSDRRAPPRGAVSLRVSPTWIMSGSLMRFQRARSRWSTPCCHAIL